MTDDEILAELRAADGRGFPLDAGNRIPMTEDDAGAMPAEPAAIPATKPERRGA